MSQPWVRRKAERDITDYREPSEALGDRIKNRFLSLLAKTVRELEPKAKREYGAW
jgi:hypothetical protein